jgi:hypothetical protein
VDNKGVKMTLWTSQNKDRSGLQKIDGIFDSELQEAISAAFRQEVTDKQIQDYSVVHDEVGLAKLF